MLVKADGTLRFTDCTWLLVFQEVHRTPGQGSEATRWNGRSNSACIADWIIGRKV